MKTNKILLGGIAGGVALFLLGGLIYGMLLMDYMAANYDQSFMKPMDETIWWALILSNMAYGFLLAVVFSWSNITSIITGAKVAGIIGILLSLFMNLSFYSMSNLYPSLQVAGVDLIAFTVMSVITGVIIVWVMNMVKK